MVPAQENGGQLTRGHANREFKITEEHINIWGYENMKALTDFKLPKIDEKWIQWMDGVSALKGKYAQVQVNMQQLADNYNKRIN